ncbi:DUF2304 family protein [Haladaptatus sp. AB618]|uniref:DUF2304 family protein n=1 Tax=Haladaptatus sp. AB618 TaxID=2934173 RepID=UPI0034E94830
MSVPEKAIHDGKILITDQVNRRNMDNKSSIIIVAVVVIVSFLFSSELSNIYREVGFESPIPLLLLLLVILGLTILYQSHRIKQLDR